MQITSDNDALKFLRWLNSNDALDVLCDNSPLTRGNINSVAQSYIKSISLNKGTKYSRVIMLPKMAKVPINTKNNAAETIFPIQLIKKINELKETGSSNKEIAQYIRYIHGNSKKQAEELIELAIRYSKIKYKMIILSPNTKKIISMYGDDLHYMTSNIVDLYFPRDKKWNVYKMADILGLDTTDIPYIAIWRNDINHVKYLDIAKLTSSEIFEVVRNIVRVLRSTNSIKAAIDGTKITVNEMKKLSYLQKEQQITKEEAKNANQQINMLANSLNIDLPFISDNAAKWATFLGTSIGIISFILQIV